MPKPWLLPMWRAPALLLLLFTAFLVMAVLYIRYGVHWPLRATGRRAIGWWMRRLNAVLGLKVVASCPPCDPPVLMVANHVSWLDILAINAVTPGLFVAKREVRSWPLLGPLAASAGTLFIRRDSLAYLPRLTRNIADALRRGGQVVAFPEGTSSDGRAVKPFSAALFQAATDAPAAVQAITIQYRRNGGHDAIAPFVGDAGFVRHLLRIMMTETTQACLTFSPAIDAQGRRRGVLAEYTHRQISDQIARTYSGPSLVVVPATCEHVPERADVSPLVRENAGRV